MAFGGNNNCFIFNRDGLSLPVILITITIQDHIACLMAAHHSSHPPAFTFQVNCWTSPLTPYLTWQQFIFCVENGYPGANLSTGIECWPSDSLAKKLQISGDIINTMEHPSPNQPMPYAGLPVQALPGNYQLQLLLMVQSPEEQQENWAQFIARDDSGGILFDQPIQMLNLIQNNGDPVTPDLLSSIVAIQVSLVGNAEQHCLLSSGSGTIAYEGSLVPLSWQSGLPSVAYPSSGTLETANSVYSEPTLSEQGLTQFFCTSQYTPGAALVATQKFGNPNETYLLAIGTTGQLTQFNYKADAIPQDGWKMQPPVGPELTVLPGLDGFLPFAPPGAALATCAQVGVQDRTMVFVVDGSGQLSRFWIDGGQAWQGPSTVGNPTPVFPPGAPIATSQQFGAFEQTDVFVVDNSGNLNVWFVNGGGDWLGPTPFEPSNEDSFAFVPGSSLAASQLFGPPSTTAVFLVDTLGRLDYVWVEGNGAWNGPEAISGDRFQAPPGAPVAVSQRFGVQDQTDVFVVDTEGQLWVFSGTYRFSEVDREFKLRWLAKQIGPVSSPESSSILAPPGAQLVASAQFGTLDQTNVFLVDNTGTLQVYSATGASHWDGPFAVFTPSTEPNQLYAPRGSYIAVCQQAGISPSQTDVFVIFNLQTGDWATDAFGDVIGGGWPCLCSSQESGQWSGAAIVAFQV